MVSMLDSGWSGPHLSTGELGTLFCVVG